MNDPWQRCIEACAEGALVEQIRGPFRRAFRLHPRRGGFSPVWKDVEAISWSQNGFFHAADEDPGNYLDYHCGVIYPQDAASQLPVALLDVQAGDYVLDACAAPGSKTTGLALAMNDSGCVIATDASPVRRRVIRENVSRQGLINVAVTPCSIVDLNERQIRCDAALVDVPCSGHELRSRKQVQKMAKKQLRILEQAAACVRSGGRLVYSTCTMYFEENEDIIDVFLKSHQDWYIDKIQVGDLKLNDQGSLRLWPYDYQTEPFFSCLLRRHGDSAVHIPRKFNVETDKEFPYQIPDGSCCMKLNTMRLWCNQEVADLDIPLQSRGILLAEETERGLRINNWAAQALIERGLDAHVVTYEEALLLWKGESLGAMNGAQLIKTESGAPVGISREKDFRLNLSSRAYRSLR